MPRTARMARSRAWIGTALCLLAALSSACATPPILLTPTPTPLPTATPTLAGTVLPGSNVVLQQNVLFGTDGTEPLLLDAYVPSNRGGHPRPALIFIHGGGWISGSKEDWAPYVTAFAAMGWVVFSINYRLDSPTPFPSELRDVEMAIHWVRTNAAPYAVDPGRIGLVGSSAGANLAALAGMEGSGPWNVGTRVSAVVSWSGPLDLTTIAQQGLAAQTAGCTPAYCSPDSDIAINLVTRYMGCSLDACRSQYAQASPTSFVDPTDPPTLLANSADEIIPAAQAQEMAQALQSAGVPYQLVIAPGGSHGLKDSSFALPATIQFLRKYLPDG